MVGALVQSEAVAASEAKLLASAVRAALEFNTALVSHVDTLLGSLDQSREDWALMRGNPEPTELVALASEELRFLAALPARVKLASEVAASLFCAVDGMRVMAGGHEMSEEVEAALEQLRGQVAVLATVQGQEVSAAIASLDASLSRAVQCAGVRPEGARGDVRAAKAAETR